jgi:hypothetical protein
MEARSIHRSAILKTLDASVSVSAGAYVPTLMERRKWFHENRNACSYRGRGGGGGIVEEIVAAITSILAPSVYFAISTCLEIHIEVTAVSTRFLICGSSQLSFEILIRNGKERTIYSPYLMHLPFKLVLSNPNY